MGRWTVCAVTALIFLAGCIVGDRVETLGPMVFQDATLDTYKSNSLVVLPFETPPLGDPRVGKEASALFYDGLRSTGKVKQVGLENSLEWYQDGYSDSEKLESAVRMAKDRGYDLVLFGGLGGLRRGKGSKAELSLTVRIVDTKTHETIFFGVETLSGKVREYDFRSLSANERVPLFEITFDHPRNLYEMLVKAVRDLLLSILSPI